MEIDVIQEFCINFVGASFDCQSDHVDEDYVYYGSKQANCLKSSKTTKKTWRQAASDCEEQGAILYTSLEHEIAQSKSIWTHGPLQQSGKTDSSILNNELKF